MSLCGPCSMTWHYVWFGVWSCQIPSHVVLNSTTKVNDIWFLSIFLVLLWVPSISELIHVTQDDHLGHFCCGLYSGITMHSCFICKSVSAQCLSLSLFLYIYHLSSFASALQPAWSLSDQMAIYNANVFKLNDYFVELNPANFKDLSMILDWIHRRNYFE